MKRKKITVIIIAIIVIILIMAIFAIYKNSWHSRIQASKFKIKDDYITGQLKNKTSKAYDIKITFLLKNGSIKDEDTCYEMIKENEIISVECVTYDRKGYKVSIKDIEFEEKKVKKLKNGKIGEEELEYYFTDIYEEHRLNLLGISHSAGASVVDSPYIKKITYNEEDNTVEIEGKIENENNPNYFKYSETFDITNNRLTEFYAFIATKNDEEFISSMQTSISLMHSFNRDTINGSKILSALEHEEIGLDKCLLVGTEWCVSSLIVGNTYSYFISEQ